MMNRSNLLAARLGAAICALGAASVNMRIGATPMAALWFVTGAIWALLTVHTLMEMRRFAAWRRRFEAELAARRPPA